MSDSLDARIRRASWLLQSIQIRRAARQTFDLTRLGNGSAERLCSALILGAAFCLLALFLSHFAKLQTAYGVGVAGIAFVSVMAASSVLVLWKSDAELETELPRLRKELADLRQRGAEEQAAREVELREAQRTADEEQASHEQAAMEAAREATPTTKQCPYCREEILIQAVKCKHCGEILDEDLRLARAPAPSPFVPPVAVQFNEEQQRQPRQYWNPGVAAVLSFLIPGLGQMYKGQVLNGFFWLIIVLCGYACFLFPGFFLHVICVFGAASGSE